MESPEMTKARHSFTGGDRRRNAQRREDRKAAKGLGALYRLLEAERLEARKLTKREAKRLQVRTGLQVLHPRTKHAKYPGGLNVTIQAFRMIRI